MRFFATMLPALALSGLATTLILPSSVAANAPDTENWSCRFCLTPSGWAGYAELGLLSVSEDSAAFGNARGLEESGIYGLAGAQASWLGSHGGFGRVDAANLPLDARWLQLGAGRFGRYRMGLEYREIPRNQGQVQTPFRRSGNSLELPADWQTAGSTAAFPNPDGGRQSLDSERQRISLTAAAAPGRHWQLNLKLRRDERSGQSLRSGTVLTQAVQLAAPLDLVTDQVDLQARYARSSWHVDVGYSGSWLRNADDSLSWDNPYTPPVDGAQRGRLATAPDNQHHQLSLGGQLELRPDLNLAAAVALGRSEQDETFIAATENPNLAVVLPRDSLNGRIETLSAQLKLSYSPLPELNLRVEHLLDDRDNQTPVALWKPVLTEVTTLEPRANRPYSFTQNRSRLTAIWRPQRELRVQARIERDSRERTLQQLETTDDDSLQLKLRWQPWRHSSLAVELSNSRRTASGTADAPANGENSRLRQFHLADRDRLQGRLRLEHRLHAAWQFGANAHWSDQDYQHSEVGLTQAEEAGVSGDVSWTPATDIAAHAFVSWTHIAGQLAGSQQFGPADWTGRSEDRLLSAGLGLRYTDIVGPLDAELDLSSTEATGEVAVSNGATLPGFPELQSRLDVLRLNFSYPVRSRLNLRLGWWLERYDSQDWASDGVGTTTVPNVYGLGLTSPHQTIHTLWLSARYVL